MSSCCCAYCARAVCKASGLLWLDRLLSVLCCFAQQDRLTAIHALAPPLYELVEKNRWAGVSNGRFDISNSRLFAVSAG